MVKLIASDLDGTLLQNGAHDVNPIVFDQIRTLKEHGIMFAAASGRQYLNLRRLFTPVQDDIAYIAENGSLCIYNEETISKGIIEQDLAYHILDEVAKYPQYNCIISGERVCYSTSKNPEFYNHMVNVIQNNMKFIDDPRTEIPEPILKIAVCDYSGTDACEKHLKEMFSSDIKVVTSGNLWVDFICPTANKGSALKDLIDHLHIEAKDCVVFGDQYNDVEMLQTAGTSYAMANAQYYIQAAALNEANIAVCNIAHFPSSFRESYWNTTNTIYFSYFSKILHRRNACTYASTANPKNTHIILAITKDLDVNNVKMSDPTLKPTITIVDGICAAARSSALRSVAKIPFSNLAIYGNRYWNISIHIPRITASTIRIILYILSLPLFRTPMIRKSTNSSMATTAMTSQQMVAGLKFLL